MPVKQVCILNFDDSLLKQKLLLKNYNPEIIDLRKLGPSARYFLNANTRKLIEKSIRGLAKGSIVFLGSGDFHHISEILISRFSEPMAVISFDFHPDWEALPPRYGCGSWVSEVLKKSNIEKLVIVGPSSDDLDSFNVQSGALSQLENDRVEIYPYEHKESFVFLKKVPRNSSLKSEQKGIFTKIYWSQLKDMDIGKFFEGVLKRIPQQKVYVSIDKDCLKKDFAVTNWEEGRLSLDELFLMLRLIKEKKDIVGLDITGEYSPIRVKGIFKKITSRLDHPKVFPQNSLTESAINELNEGTNLKILQFLYGAYR